MRTLFLGTPEFAVPSLERLIACPLTEVVGVVTQPDRPAGRGNKLHLPPTKLIALAHNIPVLQPERLSRSPETVQSMRELNADLIAMVAFGQILKKEVLTLCPLGVINVHASLLPKLRGAAPINWSIINGDRLAGVTTMYTEKGVDTGPMLLKRELPIADDMTAEELSQELSRIGADLLIETIEQLHEGRLVAVRQDDSEATLAPVLTREMGKIDWHLPAWRIHNLVRGLYPWPGTYAIFREQPLKIIKTACRPLGQDQPQSLPAGTIVKAADCISVACGEEGRERLELVSVKPPNKQTVSARDWANGARLAGQEILG